MPPLRAPAHRVDGRATTGRKQTTETGNDRRQVPGTGDSGQRRTTGHQGRGERRQHNHHTYTDSRPSGQRQRTTGTQGPGSGPHDDEHRHPHNDNERCQHQHRHLTTTTHQQGRQTATVPHGGDGATRMTEHPPQPCELLLARWIAGAAS
jgi:hypothetical protein